MHSTFHREYRVLASLHENESGAETMIRCVHSEDKLRPYIGQVQDRSRRLCHFLRITSLLIMTPRYQSTKLNRLYGPVPNSLLSGSTDAVSSSNCTCTLLMLRFGSTASVDGVINGTEISSS
ncbi:hypothetical protein PoB_003290200 [Plakobranchus ocellatus]|uniref:Uncharacterized protein n=1 Tax=Plakobranchus ocellatus TaxID=259542 RepID=A0AAV4AGM0_9GAST|nr:hypothetical protein PoB_003290200 [Plakobranchus ocellatus]